MKRVIFLSRFVFPDHSATSQILSDLALHLSGCGYDVKVITSRQRYDEPNALLPEVETICGIAVHRLVTTRFGRTVLLRRGLDYFSCYALIRASFFSWRSVAISWWQKPTHRSLASSQCMLPSAGAFVINWLQDLYPEIAFQLGVPFIRGPLGRGLLHLRDASRAASLM